MSDGPPAPQAATCTNCGRSEVRHTVRICPNCGAVLPGMTGGRINRTGFAALAQQLPPREAPVRAVRESDPTFEGEGKQPWAITPILLPETRAEPDAEVEDLSGPFLTQSVRGDRALGFAGEVAAVALGVGTLVAVGEASSSPTLPDWSPAVILVAGAASFMLCLWQAKRLRETYPQLARGWYAGRTVWINTILSFLIGGVVVGLILLLLGPLGLLAICVGSVFVMALGPLAWLLLAVIVFIIGRMVLYAIRGKRIR